MRIVERKWRVLGTLLGALLLVGAGAAPTDGPPDQPRRALRIGLVGSGSFLPLPPAMMPDTPERWVMEQVYGPGLVWPGTELDPEPQLALATRAYEVVRPGQLLYSVRTDVHFHNGSLLGLSSYYETFDLYRRLARAGDPDIDPAFAHLDSVWIDMDLQRVGIWMRPALLQEAARRIATVVPIPPKLVRLVNGLGPREARGVLLGEEPTGLGGYRWNITVPTRPEAAFSGPVIELRANPDYFEDAPEFDRVEIRFFPNDRQLIQAFVTDQVDVVRLPNWQASSTLRQQLQFARTHKIFRTYPSRDHFYFLAFNTSQPRLQRTELRRAMAFALDRRKLRAGPPATGLIGEAPVQPERSDIQRSGRRSRTASVILQRELGYRVSRGVLRDGQGRELRFTLHYPNHVEHYETMARQISVDLARLGFVINPVPVPPQELRDRLRTGDYELAIFEMTLPPTTDVLRKYFHSENAASGVNFTRYSNRTFESNIEAVLRGDLPNAESYRQGALNRLREDFPLVPLYFPTNVYYAFSTDVVEPESVGRINSYLQPLARWRRNR